MNYRARPWPAFAPRYAPAIAALASWIFCFSENVTEMRDGKSLRCARGLHVFGFGRRPQHDHDAPDAVMAISRFLR